MARILVNFIHNKQKDEYEILVDSKYVFADMAVAVLETEEDIKKPLVVPIKNVLTVVDRDRYEVHNKKFKLLANEKGDVFEHENGVEIWLPKETDISKLKYINNQLVMVDDKEEKQEPKKEEKPQPKKNKKAN